MFLRYYFLSIGLMVSVAVAYSAQSTSDLDPMAGETYYFMVAMGRTRAPLDRSDGMREVDIRGRNGPRRVLVRKSELLDLNGKTKGLKAGVAELIAWLRTSARDYARKRLQELLGQTLDGPDDWQRWYLAHEAYLYSTTVDDRLHLDTDAMAANVPTGIYRRDHPWPTKR